MCATYATYGDVRRRTATYGDVIYPVVGAVLTGASMYALGRADAVTGPVSLIIPLVGAILDVARGHPGGRGRRGSARVLTGEC
jgi:hypothetical protein